MHEPLLIPYHIFDPSLDFQNSPFLLPVSLSTSIVHCNNCCINCIKFESRLYQVRKKSIVSIVSKMNGRQVLALAMCCLMFSTLYIESGEAQMARKKRILKIIIGASSFLRFVKPKKGILPVPLPLPIPMPIEWEQPPIVRINSINTMYRIVSIVFSTFS